MHEYVTGVIGRMSPKDQMLVIYDQLNMAYANYYTRQEVLDLMSEIGFVDVSVYHRRGYSLSVTGAKPLRKN